MAKRRQEMTALKLLGIIIAIICVLFIAYVAACAICGWVNPNSGFTYYFEHIFGLIPPATTETAEAGTTALLTNA